MKVGIKAITGIGLLLALQGLAASKTIVISGTVLDRQDLVVGAVTALGSATLAGGANNYPLCTIVEKSNSGAGYTVTVQSANAGSGSVPKLIGSLTGSRNEITYSLTYGGNPVTFSGGEAVLTDATSKTPGSGSSKTLGITIPQNQNPGADTYSDVLTVTLAAK